MCLGGIGILHRDSREKGSVEIWYIGVMSVDGAVGRAWWCVIGGVVGVWLFGVVGGAVGAWFAVGCGLVGVGIVVSGVWRSGCLVLAVGALMGGYTGVRVGTVSGDRVDVLSGVVDGGEGIVRFRGVVVGGIELREGRGEVWEPVMWEGVRGRLLVRVEGVFVGGEIEEKRRPPPSLRDTSPAGEGQERSGRWARASGVVRVVMSREDGEGLRVGDVVEVMGMMRGNFEARNVGGRDWVGVANMEGRAGVISVVGGGGIEVVGVGGGVWNSVMRWREGVRGRALVSLGLDGLADGEDAGRVVLGALILGERAAGGREVERGFARVGVGHVLAISGFHVALLVGMCVLLVRLVGLERWFGGWVECGVVCLVLIGMWVVVPVRVPMVRAMVLIGAIMVGRGMGRRYDTMSVLGWVALGLMVWRPLDVLGLGWQLSVGVTGLLVWMGRSKEVGVARKTRRGGMLVGMLGGGWNVFRMNGACWLLAMPAIMLHVGTVSVVGFVMAVVVAAMAGVLMVLGYLQVLVGVVWPALGGETLFIVEWAAGVVAGFVGWVDGMGWSSVRGWNFGTAWTICATGLVWLVLTGARVVTRGRVGVACLVLLVWGGAQYRMVSYVDGVRVEMVDVGDGSAYLVRSGNEAMLYDCGSLDFRVGSTVERMAWARGVRRIDSVIVSHDNLDHFNGLVELVRAGVGFERLYVGGAMELEPSVAWAGVRAELVGLGVEIFEMGVGDRFVFGEGYVECVGGGGMEKFSEKIEEARGSQKSGEPSPRPSPIRMGEGGRGGLHVNDTSLVVRVEVETEAGELAVLFTGDVDEGGIGGLVEEDFEGVVVLELPHHGSMNSAVRGFVGLVDPAVVLQSTGPERVDGRWEFLHKGRSWYASGGVDGGGAWAQVLGSGEVLSGWAVGE